MEGLHITIKDNSPEVLEALKNAIERGLTACGLSAEEHARDKAPRASGNLHDHITSNVDDKTMKVGVTPMKPQYGIYVEFGTGIYAEGGGRPTPWVYQDKNGNWHMTRGMQARPYIRPAISEHIEEYYNILKSSLENA